MILASFSEVCYTAVKKNAYHPGADSYVENQQFRGRWGWEINTGQPRSVHHVDNGLDGVEGEGILR